MIKIYSTTQCPSCNMVKRYLTAKKVQFETINLDEQPERRAEAIAVAGGRLTVPVTTNGKYTVTGWNVPELNILLDSE